MADLLSLDGRIVVVSGAGGGGIGTTVTAHGGPRRGDRRRGQPVGRRTSTDHIGPLVAEGLPSSRWRPTRRPTRASPTALDAVRRADG